MSRVVLAMSGGVDSSVAAHLLVEQGHDVIGVFMRHGQGSPVECRGEVGGRGSGVGEGKLVLPIVQRLDHKQGCCTAADAEDARRIADKLDIPFYALDLDVDFGRIIDYFVDEYTAARTPNPCIVCNHWIKFGKLFDYADSAQAEFVATGHYARIVGGSLRAPHPGKTITPQPRLARREASPSVSVSETPSYTRLAEDADGLPWLERGLDASKDQSYVLFGIDRALLPRMMLPVGRFEKTEIREIAARLGLRVAQKPDSQEICFVTEGRYDEFVRARRSGIDTSGQLVTTDGTVVGHHAGIEGFTIGQRKGLGVALGEPRYVVRIESDTRRVVIGERDELLCSELTASSTNWHINPPTQPTRCQVQIRYNAPAVSAEISILSDERLSVEFDQPQFGVAPGQAVVCYDGDRVLGGGWID